MQNGSGGDSQWMEVPVPLMLTIDVDTVLFFEQCEVNGFPDTVMREREIQQLLSNSKDKI